MSVQYGLLTKEHLNVLARQLPEVELAAAADNIYAIGAMQDHCICGVLVFRADGEILIDIQYIAVAEAYRRQGIADGLIDFLCKSAWKSTTAVLCTFAAKDWDAPLCRLFIRRGDFTLAETESYICRFPCRELPQVRWNATLPSGMRIATFYDLPELLQRRFINEMKQDNQEFAEGICAERKQMLHPLCICAVDASATVQVAIFCQRREQDIELSLAYCAHGHVNALIALFARLRELLIRAGDYVSDLWIAAVTPQSRKLIDKLLPEREIIEKFYTACWDMNTMGGEDDGYE